MAVQEQTPLREYTANGVTTSFALGFDCEETNHLIVTIDDVEVLPTDWYLSGSNVIFWNAPGNGKLIKLQRNTPFNRLADYQSYNNSFRPPAINKDFDRIWWKLQELGVADWILHNRIDALKAYVDDRDDELRAYLMEEIRKQGVALDQLDEYYNYLMQRLAQIAVDKGWDASFVVDGDENQHEINSKTARIAKTIKDLIAIQSPKDGQTAHVLGYHSATNFALAKPYQGGGQFVFNASLEKSKHNGGTIIDPGRPFPTDWSNQDQVQTWFTPASSGNGVWVRISSDEYTIKVDDFGAMGDGIHDDRIPLQATYNFLNSVGGGTVYYSSNNTYLVNSYLYKYFHGELLQLYSNITHISDGATIKVGAFFDDKIFVLFNGFDNQTAELSSLIYNVKFDGLTFDFSGDVSCMRTSYKRRVGIQTGRVIGGYVRNCKFKNGDLQNAIIAGWGDTGDSFNVYESDFVELIKESPENIDYTAVYLCTKNSYVTNCTFLEISVRAYEIGCAVELHATNSRFTNSFVGGLTKTCFLVADPTENTTVTDLKVSGIVGFVANSLTSPWSGDGCILARLDISNNYMRSYQLAGTSIDVHGYRGLVTTYASFGSGLYADIWVKGNVCVIENSANPNTATAVYSTAKMDRLVVDGNELVNCHDGVVLLAADQDWSGLKITRNNFSGVNPSALLRLTGNNLDNIVVYGNTANYFGTFDVPINITSNTITNSSIQETEFTEAVPQTREFTYPSGFLSAVSNKATFKLYARQLNTPALAAGGVGAATVNVPTDCIKAGCSYEFIGAIPSQIALASKTVASANPVAFIALNKEAYAIGGDAPTGSLRVSINN